MSDTLITEVQWILATVCVLTGSVVIVANWHIVVSGIRGQKSSMVPLAGGVVGALGLLIAPTYTMRSLWLLPLVIDPGSGFLVVGSISYWILRWLKGDTTEG